MTGITDFLKGSLLIGIRGGSPERFFNLCAAGKIHPKKIRRKGEGYEMYLDLKSFYRLRPLIRKTKVRAAVLKRTGLPFFMPELKKRGMFVGCAIVAFGLWYLSSMFLWSVQVEGNSGVTRQQVLRFLEKQGASVGSRRDLLDLNELEKEFRKSFPQVLWTSWKLKGTRLEISMKENDTELCEKSKEAGSGADLVSPYDGCIVSMIVRSGTAQVKTGDEVKAGEILVRGMVPVLTEEGTVREEMPVRADADIFLKHQRQVREVLPEIYTEKQFTGRSRKRYGIRWMSREIYLPGHKEFYREIRLREGTAGEKDQPPHLPAGIFTEVSLEYLPVIRKYNAEDAGELLQGKFAKFLVTLEEKGVQIIEKNVRISNEGNFWILSGEICIAEKLDGPSEAERN